jgi:hypothetical protein
MHPRVYFVSLVLGVSLLVLVIRLIQKGRLDIAYCWLWLCIGFLAPLIVIKYDWLLWFSNLIGVVSPLTTLFLFSSLVLFLLCLQFSMVISSHRRKIKILTQQIALLSADRKDP